MAQPDLTVWRETRKDDVKAAVKRAQTISPFDSTCLLVEGFHKFMQRDAPSTLTGVSFNRIAGQAIGLKDVESREEVARMLKAIRPGGAFVILGHGGVIPCGAVDAKIKAIDAAKQGRTLDETPAVLELLDRVSPEVHGKKSPEAELVNAMFQAQKVMTDSEFSFLIKRNNLTVLVAIISDCKDIRYYLMNREVWSEENPKGWNEEKMFATHPKLYSLKYQLSEGLGKVVRDGIDLKTHYAHATFIYDPLDLRTVLDPGVSTLEVGGICCVDARLKPNTPDSPKYLFKVPPNQTFDITVDLDPEGNVNMSVGDIGSDDYRRKHVSGTRTEGHGDKGNGHVVTVATSLEFAMNIKEARISNNGGINPADITAAAFDGRSLRLLNPAIDVDWHIEYRPDVPICAVTPHIRK
jgi:hypothetical protein